MSLFKHQAEKVAALRKIPFLSSVNDEDLKRLALNVGEKDAKAGEVLIEQGHAGSSLFMILNGSAGVARDGEQIATRGPGEFVGELSLLLGDPCNATVTVLEDCRLLELERRPFNALLDSAPTLTKQILKDVARRFSDLNG
jgi:CRP-like cAMP-binding protein